MRAGLLRHPIKIVQSKVTGQDTFGQDVFGSPVVYCETMAEIQGQAGREFVAMQQRYPELKYLLIFRYIAGLDTSMDIITEFGVMDVLNFTDPDGRYREIQAPCRQRTFTEPNEQAVYAALWGSSNWMVPGD